MSVEIRRLVIDPQLDPQIARIGTVVNRLVDMANGNGGGRLWLLHDDGNKKATSGSSGVLPGAVLSANNYPLRVEPTSTNQVNVLHSNGATIGLRVQDGGLTTGVPASLTSTLAVTGATTLSSTLAVTGATTLSSTLAVTGATTLSSTLAVTGATTLTGALVANGAVTLGDAAADVVSVLGTMTVTPLATFTTGVATGALPAAAGALRLSTASIINARNAGNTANISMIQTNSSDHVIVGDAVDSAIAIVQALTSINLQISGTKRIEADGTGLGFFNKAPAAQPAAGAAAGGTLAQVTTLANDLRTGLRDLGLFS